jgi:hypothetical protein
MLSPNSGDASVVTLQSVLILGHAAHACLPKVPLPPLFNAADPAGAPILTLAPAVSLYISRRCSAEPCARVGDQKEIAIGI